MRPTLAGIDHIHIHVASWEKAEIWYRELLGFKRMEALMSWAVDGGPLTLESPGGKVHLALFEREEHTGSSAIAFAASGQEFLDWKLYLQSKAVELRVADHALAFSLYFSDPDNNLHEITTYDHDLVRENLG